MRWVGIALMVLLPVGVVAQELSPAERIAALETLVQHLNKARAAAEQDTSLEISRLRTNNYHLANQVKLLKDELEKLRKAAAAGHP